MNRWPWQRKPERKVRLDVINAVELKPEANYILVADHKHFSRPDMEQVMKDLRKAGVRNVVSFLLGGSPEEAVQIISKEKTHATKSTRRKYS